MRGTIMRFILLFLVTIVFCFNSAFSQTVQNSPQRFLYHIWGSVLDEQSQLMANISVCFLWVDGPLQGRIPCTKTNYEGEFALIVKGVPDKYVVSASTREQPFRFVENKDKNYRFKSTEPIEFGAKDECRKVTLQFDAKQEVK